MTSKFATLVQVIDALRREAPAAYKRYRPKEDEPEKLNNAMSRSFIHLYLKVKFGILDFMSREYLITDDSDDGGVDAYFIDKKNKVVHIIQSKFRISEKNFEEKQLSLDDLARMEVDEIVKGQENGSNGRPYNGKIKQFQSEVNDTHLITQYNYKIVVLANFKHHDILEKIYKGYKIDVFDYSRSYSELVFPVVSGTYFKAGDLHISINLENTNSGNTRVSYTATVGSIEAEVTLIFAPVKEIGAVMSTYRNSILKYNPRSYLGLSNNEVNSSIAQTIIDSTGNEFALYNNGITIVADEAGYSDKTGKKSVAHLDLINPQIINGGQTAYTLCKIYDDTKSGKTPPEVLEGKEVLLKIITIDPSGSTEEERRALIEKISRATNHQTSVDEADRRSSETIQLKLQKLFFDKYGLFYERKAGEFFDGLQSGYIGKEMLVDREQLMRVALARNHQISETRARIKNFFSTEAFEKNPLSEDDIDKYAFGYACYQFLTSELSRSRKMKTPYFERKYGTALRYGRFAVVAVAINKFWVRGEQDPEQAATQVLNQWIDFEKWAKEQPRNVRYFGVSKNDWVSYYKGETINIDVKDFDFSMAETN